MELGALKFNKIEPWGWLDRSLLFLIMYIVYHRGFHDYIY